MIYVPCTVFSDAACIVPPFGRTQYAFGLVVFTLNAYIVLLSSFRNVNVVVEVCTNGGLNDRISAGFSMTVIAICDVCQSDLLKLHDKSSEPDLNLVLYVGYQEREC